MYKTCTVFLFILSFCVVGKAQNTDSPVQLLKFNLLAPADVFAFPTIQVAYERQVTKQFSTSVELGYQFLGSNMFENVSDTSFVTPNGFKASVEGRYYIRFPHHRKRIAQSDLSGLYAGLNLFCRSNRYNYSWSHLDVSNINNIQETDAMWVRKTNTGFLLFYGYQTIISRISFEASCGLGAQYRSVKNHNRDYTYSDKDLPQPFKELILPFDKNYFNLSEYSGWNFALNYSLRVGYRF